MKKKIISVKKLVKKFPKSIAFGIKEFLVNKKIRNYSKYNRKFALQNINFDLIAGNSLAILGHNGSGKSTILSLLANVISPTSGSVYINGKLMSLLELTTGMVGELSGYENIFLYSSIISKPYSSIKNDLDEIISFSELGSSIYEPVKTYSSGMRARLAFSILKSSNPDIFLIDEVYAVGDQNFQKKCKLYLKKFIANGGTLVLVSHDLNIIKELCKKGLVLNEGKQIFFGEVGEAVKKYKNYMDQALVN